MIKEFETPDLVIMQVCNGQAVDIVSWDDADLYLKKMYEACPDHTKVYMLNAGFDTRVLNNVHMNMFLMQDRLIDVGARHKLYKVSQQGYYEQPVSLANLTKLYLNRELPKPVDVRTGFTREETLSAEHVKYAALDAAVTWAIGQRMPEMPTEALQTKAGVALSIIETNGFMVDAESWVTKHQQLAAEMEDAREQLLVMGFDADPKAITPKGMFKLLCSRVGLDPDRWKPWSVPRLRGALYRVLTSIDRPYAEICKDLRSAVKALTAERFKLPKKDETALAELLVRIDMEELTTCRKSRPFYKVIDTILTLREKGTPVEETLQKLSAQYNAAGGWEDDSAFKGPTSYLQDHLHKLQAAHGIQLPQTATGKLKLSKDEMWRLEAKGIHDEFLELYLKFKHLEKILGTYLDNDKVASDGRIHPRFEVMVRTFRTSCSKPNLQNLPRDDGIRELFRAPKGKVLVSLDYDQLELCSLAQHNYTTFGISRMRELINAKIDLHSWFACRVLGWITDENDYDGSEESRQRVLPILARLKKEQPKTRQRAKAADFGFPGGMSANRFLNECWKNGMYDMTYEEAEHLRNAWFEAFPEMDYFMAPTECGARQGGDPDHRYMASNIVGNVRRHCSFNSAVNFPFQSLAAAGAKNAMWQLTVAGYKIVNYIHDEFILELSEEDYHEKSVMAKDIMIKAMKEFIPDVRINAEPAAMQFWYKSAEPVFDKDGKLQIWKPTQ